MDKRIKQLRKILNLTQQEFANRIGIKRNTIANYEVGRNDPIDSVISLICREFHVNETWLRTGEGEMFEPEPRSSLDLLAEAHGLTGDQRVLLEKFIGLTPEVRQGILDYVLSVAAAVSGEDREAPPEMTPEELHAELDRQLKREKTAEAASGA